MKVIKVGSRYETYHDELETFEQLPAQTYIVRFHKMMGFYLDKYAELEVKESKIYGVHDDKVAKVLKSFEHFDKNLGVILSGNKGIGKSLFAKLLAKKAVESGIPVIIVDRFVPGINSYLEEIDQEVLILFDEFDKTFGNIQTGDNEADPQAGMLSLFDGISPGKKLFVITCNELRKLNDYLVNRPGRFHYHFRFEYPSAMEIKEYLRDKLDEKYYKEIDKVVLFSRKIDLNYDCLRAIAFELNTGESFESAIKDLNIINVNQERYNVVLYMNDGSTLSSRNVYLDLFNKEETKYIGLYDKEGRDLLNVGFDVTNCQYDYAMQAQIVPAEALKLEYDEFYLREEKEIMEKLKSLEPLYMTITRIKEKGIHYTV